MHSAPIPSRPNGVPRIPARAVERTDLLTCMDALAPLTIISGLAGAGKTTLAAQWAARRQNLGNTVWWFDAAGPVDLSVTDRPPAAGDDQASEYQAGEESESLRIIVIDNAEGLTDPQILNDLVQRLSADQQLHLLLCSSIPHPIVPRAQNAGIPADVICGHQLGINVEQIPQFAASWGHDIDVEVAAKLYEGLGGCLSSLHFALDHINTESDPYGTRAAENFLRDRVLPQLMAHGLLTATTMVATSEYIALPLIEQLFAQGTPGAEVIGDSRPRELIERLAGMGFLYTIDCETDTIWRFPTVPAAILASNLETADPELARFVHRVTAAWLSARPKLDCDGLAGLAVRQSRAGEDWDQLARLWNGYGVFLANKHPVESYDAFRNISDNVIAEHPELALAASVAASFDPHISSNRHSATISSYQQAGWALPTLPSGQHRPDILTVTAAMIGARQNGRAAQAHRLARRYANQIPPATSAAAGLNVAWFELQSGISAIAAGEDIEAIQKWESALRTAQLFGSDELTSAATGQLALLHAIGGYRQAASKYLEEHRSIDLGSYWMKTPMIAPGQIAAGILKADRLDASAAAEYDIPGAEDIEEWAVLTWARTQYALMFGDPLLAMSEITRLSTTHQYALRPENMDKLIVDRCLADLYLALGELNRCQRHIHDAGPDQRTMAVPQARLAYICGDYGTARSVCAAHAWDATMSVRDRIDLVALKAASAYAMEDIPSATGLMRRTMRLAEDAGTLVPYTTLPQQVFHDLLELVGNPLDTETVELIDAHRQPYPERGKLITLSPRESAVLYAMVEHETLPDVAQALVVSPNTVKKQAQAIYAKLGVHDRQSALRQAYELGLLPAPNIDSPEAAGAKPLRTVGCGCVGKQAGKLNEAPSASLGA